MFAQLEQHEQEALAPNDEARAIALDCRARHDTFQSRNSHLTSSDNNFLEAIKGRDIRSEVGGAAHVSSDFCGRLALIHSNDRRMRESCSTSLCTEKAQGNMHQNAHHSLSAHVHESLHHLRASESMTPAVA
eukprot:2133445-Pleurochrysis_carterae.AAC.1